MYEFNDCFYTYIAIVMTVFVTDPNCPFEIGGPARSLPNIEVATTANLLIGQPFPCDGIIKSYSYYRIVPDIVAFVGVFRRVNDDEVKIVSVSELKDSIPGEHVVLLSPEVRVQAGDFLGIFYQQGEVAGVIPNDVGPSTSDREDLFQNYVVRAYFSDFAPGIDTGATFSLSRLGYSVNRAKFALQADMEYPTTAGEPMSPVTIIS